MTSEWLQAAVQMNFHPLMRIENCCLPKNCCELQVPQQEMTKLKSCKFSSQEGQQQIEFDAAYDWHDLISRGSLGLAESLWLLWCWCLASTAFTATAIFTLTALKVARTSVRQRRRIFHFQCQCLSRKQKWAELNRRTEDCANRSLSREKSRRSNN